MLNSKQRAYLKGIANTIDTILMIGKGGITPQVIKQCDDALLAREIIKGKVLENAPMTPKEVASELEEEMNCDVVQVIGSKFILYRPKPKDPVIKLPKANKK